MTLNQEERGLYDLQVSLPESFESAPSIVKLGFFCLFTDYMVWHRNGFAFVCIIKVLLRQPALNESGMTVNCKSILV